MSTILRKSFTAKVVFQISILILTSNFLIPPGIRAAFEPVAIGARPAGLAGAYTALSDDVYGVYYNPAGLAFIKRSEFSAQYSQLYLGLWDKSSLGYAFAGIAQPIKFKNDYGTIGLSWLSFSVDQLYKENSLIFSYGKDLIPKRNHMISAGINLKSLSIGYGKDPDGYTDDSVDTDGKTTGMADTLFQKFGASKSAFSVDLGFQYRPFRNYVLGIGIMNLNEPAIALNPDDPAKLSRSISAGIAHTGKNYSVALDYLTRKFNQFNDYRLGIAAEQYFPFGLGVRAGIVTGSRQLSNLAVGVGFKTPSFQFDYAIEHPLTGIKGTTGNHKVSLILRFGPAIRGEELPSVELQQELEKTKQQLASATAEISKLKTQLDELLKKPAPQIVVPEIKKVPAGPEAGEVTTPSIDASARKEYRDEYTAYIKVADKLSFVERIEKVKSITDKYKDKTDVSETEQEYKILLQEQKTQEQMYRDSMSYYTKISLRGIDDKTKKDILKRIIDKFVSFGIDVSEAKEELGKLK